MAAGSAWEWLSRTIACMTMQRQYSTGRTCGALPGSPLKPPVVYLLPASWHHHSLTHPALLCKASLSPLRPWHFQESCPLI